MKESVESATAASHAELTRSPAPSLDQQVEVRELSRGSSTRRCGCAQRLQRARGRGFATSARRIEGEDLNLLRLRDPDRPASVVDRNQQRVATPNDPDVSTRRKTSGSKGVVSASATKREDHSVLIDWELVERKMN